MFLLAGKNRLRENTLAGPPTGVGWWESQLLANTMCSQIHDVVSLILEANLIVRGYYTHGEKRKWAPKDPSSQSYCTSASEFELMVRHLQLHHLMEKAGRRNMWSMTYARETEEAKRHWCLLLVMSGTGRWNELYVWLMLNSIEKLVSGWVSIQLQMHFLRLLSHIFPVLTLSSTHLLSPLSGSVHCFCPESSFRRLCLSDSYKVESLPVPLVRLWGPHVAIIQLSQSWSVKLLKSPLKFSILGFVITNLGYSVRELKLLKEGGFPAVSSSSLRCFLIR